jgi:crotonobetaine/carnitine-CoA ligase
MDITTIREPQLTRGVMAGSILVMRLFAITTATSSLLDRLKDTIRRRGENISSYEIEIELLAHKDIREAAAVPVPSEFTEDEVLVAVAPVSGRVIDAAC